MANLRTTKYSDIFTPESILYYQDHIIEFIEDIMFRNDPSLFVSEQQKEGLLAIQNNKRVAIKSGKGAGKTALVVEVIWWFMSCFPNPKIICTAPTFPTLKIALWAELSKWLNRSIIKDIFEVNDKKAYLKEDSKNWFTIPRAAKDADAAQGAHEENLLVIMDESSGIKEEIFEAFDTTITGKNNKFVMIGNPTRTSGPFFDAFNKRNDKWVTLTFNSEDSPFVTKEQISYYEEKYGRHHTLFRTMIQGEFPDGSPESFLKLSDVHDAVERYDELPNTGDVEIGLDVARFGDDLTVLYWRRGYKVYPAKVLAKNSIPEAVQLVYDTVDEIRKVHGYDKKIRVKVDDTGLGGGVSDYLKLDRDHNIEVIPCNNGGKGNDQYQNEISIMWGTIKDNIRFIGLPDDNHLIEELSARRWKLSQNGKIMIEPKSEYKKEFKSSPDRSDALVLCFAKKANEDVIVKDFDPLDSTVVRSNLSYIGEDKYASVFYSRDLTSSIIYSAWDGFRLYIYDEYIGKDSLIYVATNVHQHLPISKIIGNDSMFSLKGDDLAFKFRKFGIFLKENFSFNELSSIETLSNMVSQKRIVISDKCSQTISQLSNWKITKNKYDLENTFGLCYALCYIVSELRRKIEGKEESTMFVPYTGQKQESLKQISHSPRQDMNSWMSW